MKIKIKYGHDFEYDGYLLQFIGLNGSIMAMVQEENNHINFFNYYDILIVD